MELETLNRRNTVAVEQALKDLTAIISEQRQRMNGLQNLLYEFRTRIDGLEKLIVSCKVAAVGHGPTVK